MLSGSYFYYEASHVSGLREEAGVGAPPHNFMASVFLGSLINHGLKLMSLDCTTWPLPLFQSSLDPHHTSPPIL